MGDDAVSSVIGTVLILAITVGAFGGVAIVVLDAVEESHEAPRADIDVQQRGRNFVVLHRGGDRIDASDVDLIVYTDGVATTYSLAASDTDGTWMPGENICIPCIHGVADGVEVILRHGGSSVAAAAGTSGPVNLGSGPPDLSPISLEADPFVEGENGTFRVTVQNTGFFAAGAFTVLFEVDDVAVGNPIPVAGVPGDDSVEVESPAWSGAVGSHTLTVTVDDGDTVAEGDETNNVDELEFAVSAAGSDPELLPTDITGELFEPGQDGTFGVTIHNFGPVDAGTFTVTFAVDGAPLGPGQVVGGIVAGGSITVQSAAWSATSGSHDITVTADSADQVAESNETNNAITVSFDVGTAGTQAFQDVDNDLVYDLGLDVPLTVGPLTGADCSPASGRPCSNSDDGIIVEDDGSGPGLVIPGTSQDFVSAENIYIEAPGPVTIGVNLTGPSSGGSKDMWLVSVGGDVTATGSYTTNGDITISGAAIALTGAHVESPSLIDIQGSGDLDFEDGALVADEIIAAVADIYQDAGRLCATWDSGTGTCLVAHIDATKPSDPRATNSNGSTLIGSLTEGVWDP